jgi:hypothetical protein
MGNGFRGGGRRSRGGTDGIRLRQAYGARGTAFANPQRDELYGTHVTYEGYQFSAPHPNAPSLHYSSTPLLRVSALEASFGDRI